MTDGHLILRVSRTCGARRIEKEGYGYIPTLITVNFMGRQYCCPVDLEWQASPSVAVTGTSHRI